MAHKRSKESRERRREKRLQKIKQTSKRDLATSLLLRYSWHDPENGEIVYTTATEPFLCIKLKECFGVDYSNYPLEHDYGEVLNRFKMSAPPVNSYIFGKQRGI